MNRLISIERGKLTNRVKLIRKRHTESEKMDENIYSVTQMDNSSFIVSKIQDQGIVTYDIEMEDAKCDCSTACMDCKICIHTLSCSCPDFNIRYLICKHIHFVCRKYKIVREISMNMNCPGTSSEEGHLVIDISEKEISENVEKDIILKQINKKPRMDLDDKKANIQQLIQNISNKVQTVESFEDLEHIEDNLKNIQAYLEVTKKPERQISKISQTIPSNKKICPQRKFKIPKRKQKK